MKKFTEEEMKHIADMIASRFISADIPKYPMESVKKYVEKFDNAMQLLEEINQDRE